MQETERFQKIRARKVYSINVITIASCNYACGMCPYYGEGYTGEYFKERPSIKRNMRLDEIETILKKAQSNGIEWVDLTPNGEFFLHREWREILRLIKSYGFKIFITTNGGLLSEQDIKEACEIGIDHITVSIDSLNYEFYKIIRKPATEKAFHNAINAPKLFKKYAPQMYVQVQVTEQPEIPDNDIGEILQFFDDTPLNQISVNKMFKGSSEGMMHFGATKAKYVHGTCNGYGNPIVLPDGRVIPCCGGFYFYPKIKDKLPQLLAQDEHKATDSIREALDKLDDLYEKNEIFRRYCENCSLYDSSSTEIEEKFIYKGYFATKTSVRTRYFLLPKYLSWLPSKTVLWLYKKGHAKRIKEFLKKFGK
ncbi:MAG: radical SAM protein [Wolinella sp.]